MKVFENIKEKCPWLPYLVGLIPFITACIGYGAVEGLPLWETVYASVALYFVNPVNDAENTWILFSEVAAVIVTAGIILSVIRYAYAKVGNFFIRLHKDATVVYTDNNFGTTLLENLNHGYIPPNDITNDDDDADDVTVQPEKMKAEKVKYHIVMFENDMDNVSFFTHNEKRLQDKNVYLMMRDVDPSLLSAVNTSSVDIHFFNVYEILARDYWKKYNLYDRRNDELKIGIIGYDNVGQAIFKYGYLNNIYSLKQKIEYHVWGCGTSDSVFLKSLNTMNDDKIIVHENHWDDEFEILSGMDRIIYTPEEGSIDLMQKILYENSDTEIFCYSDKKIGLEKFYASDKVTAFGDMKDVLTEDNIKNESIYKQGKLFNYDYCLRSQNAEVPDNFLEKADEEWKKLNGFFKSSNVARADHYWIEKKLFEDGEFKEDSEDAWRMEHIRWSRFYYINHWTYAQKRDNARRHHNLLVPYEDLDYAEKAKDGFFSERIKREIDKLV